VEASVIRFYCFINNFFDSGWIADISEEAIDFGVIGRRDLCSGLLDTFGDINEHQMAFLLCELLCNSSADSSACTGDERYFAF